MGQIFTRTVTDPIKEKDGIRILVMRDFPWHTGDRMELQIDLWFRDLGPSQELKASWFQGAQDQAAWEQYAKNYLREMKRQKPLIKNLKYLSRRWDITLLCWNHDKQDKGYCHRHLLKQLIEQCQLKTP